MPSLTKYTRLLIISFLTLLAFLAFLTLLSCNGKRPAPPKDAIDAINLKRGDLVLCGPPGSRFGAVEFKTSCSGKVKGDFNLAIALLHSFEYDEAEKVFAKVIDKDPQCAMAYWGVAMCNYHPLWSPPNRAELKKGADAIAIAKSLAKNGERESDYIAAMALFYKDWDKADHHTRCMNFEKEMEKTYAKYPDDKEAAIFYALALDAAADPADKTFGNQKRAGAILESLYPGQPDHPGIVHYIIHSYDYPELAALALPAARKYAAIAPSSAHAQHMPSHIFTDLGLWDECIASNLASTSAARCYAENAGIQGHWDEELHGMDYLVYAYLQKGGNKLAKEQCDYLATIDAVYPVSFKDAYAFAAIPARYLLENRLWKEAAGLQVHPAGFPWDSFPWQKAIIHFSRLLGSVHIGRLDSAITEWQRLQAIHDTLMAQKDEYKANQVQIQIKTSEAWILFKKQKNEQAVSLMELAANLEDKTEKHPVTPGEVLPARELLGDMLLEMHKPDSALQAYEAVLKKHPNRFNALYGAGVAAERAGNPAKAASYFRQLKKIAGSPASDRPIPPAY